MVKKLLCHSSGSLKRFPHTFTTAMYIATRRACLEAREAGFLVYIKYTKDLKEESVGDAIKLC